MAAAARPVPDHGHRSVRRARAAARADQPDRRPDRRHPPVHRPDVGRPVGGDLRRLGGALHRGPARGQPGAGPGPAGHPRGRRQDHPLPPPQGHGRDPGGDRHRRDQLAGQGSRGVPPARAARARAGPGDRPAPGPGRRDGRRWRRPGRSAADPGTGRPADRHPGRRPGRPAVPARRGTGRDGVLRILPHRRRPGRPRQHRLVRPLQAAGLPVAAVQLRRGRGNPGRRGRLPRPVRLRSHRPERPVVPHAAAAGGRHRRMGSGPRVGGSRPADRVAAAGAARPRRHGPGQGAVSRSRPGEAEAELWRGHHPGGRRRAGPGGRRRPDDLARARPVRAACARTRAAAGRAAAAAGRLPVRRRRAGRRRNLRPRTARRQACAGGRRGDRGGRVRSGHGAGRAHAGRRAAGPPPPWPWPTRAATRSPPM